MKNEAITHGSRERERMLRAAYFIVAIKTDFRFNAMTLPLPPAI